jgi:hypothetical protein
MNQSIVEEKRSLKSAMEELGRKAMRLQDLTGLSETLPMKIIQPYPVVEKNPIDPNPVPADRASDQNSIIDILYNISDDLDKNIDIIGSNIQKTMRMID